MPAMIFIRVDLPAPFSPIRASTEPGRTRNCTSDNATTPGKPLLTLTTSNRYGSSGNTSGRTVAAGALEAVADANMVRYSLGKVGAATLPAYCCGGPGAASLELVDVLRRDQAIRHHDGFHFLALGHFDRRVDGAIGLALGVLEHRDRHVAFLDGVQAVRRAVDPGNQHAALLGARLLEGHGGADGHLVVVGHHRVEFTALGEPVIHQ